jgi:hypothetical protein
MNPCIDPANELNWASLLGPSSLGTNNTASQGVNLINFLGRPALRYVIGNSTAGTTPGITLLIQTSATNNASNATNWNGTTLSPITNPTSNNAAVVQGQIPIDTRGALQFLFVRAVLTGTNTPAFPVYAELVGSPHEQ